MPRKQARELSSPCAGSSVEAFTGSLQAGRRPWFGLGAGKKGGRYEQENEAGKGRQIKMPGTVVIGPEAYSGTGNLGALARAGDATFKVTEVEGYE